MIQCYEKDNTNYDANGDITLLPTQCELSTEINGTWELTMSHPLDPDGRWKYLSEEAVISAPTFQSDHQLFRVDKCVKTDSSVEVTAYPIFFDSADDCFLMDTRPTNRNGQDALNIMMQGSKYSGESDITTGGTAYFVRRNLMDAINGEDSPTFIEMWGGEILYDNFKIIINERIGGDYGVEIRYGKNMDGLSYTIDMSDVVTRIVPIAYNGRMMSGDAPWIDSDNINNYAKKYIREVKFDDVKLAEDASGREEDNIIICADQTALDAALRQKCEDMYAAGADLPSVTIEVTMIDLSKTEQYKDFADLVSVGLGDTVHCYNYKLGITTEARVIKLTWDCIRNQAGEMTLGDYEYNYFSNLTSSLQAIQQVIGPGNTIIAERVSGVLNAINTQLRYQKNVAQTADVRAILFEDTNPNSPTYGAMCLGTQGFQIADSRTADGRGWDWTTAITAQGIVANAIIAGILSDKTGKNYWNLDTGEFRLSAEAFKINDQTVQDYVVDNLTQEEVFNILTNNGASQGIYMQDGKLYINGTYIKGGTISGQTIEGGSFTTYNNGYLASRLTGTGIKFYDWSGDRSFVGAVESIHNSQLDRGNVAFYSDENSSVTIGYTTDDPEEPNASITPVMSFDPQKPTSTPYMINTSNGTLFNHNPNGGIVVENGLLKDWSIKSVLDNTLNVISSLSWNGNGELTSVQQTSIDIKDGLIVGWTVKTFDV